MGEQMPLGKAYGIIAVCMFGPGLPTEKHRHIERLDIWKNAAKYALNMDTITTVLEWPQWKEWIAQDSFKDRREAANRVQAATELPEFDE